MIHQALKSYKYFLIPVVYTSLLLLSSCSSGTSTGKEEKETKEPTKEVVKEPARKLLNYELRERAYIRAARIKSLEKLAFSYDRKKNPLPEGKLSSVLYNDKGVIVKTTNYDSKGEISSTYDYTYISDSIRTESRKYSPQGEIQNIYKYEYDEDGYKIKSSRYSPSGKLEKYYTYEYDDAGNLITENWYDASGKQEFTIRYTYDNNRRTEMVSYDDSDKTVSRYIYKYDDEGNIIEEIKYGSDGKEAGFIQYVYSYF